MYKIQVPFFITELFQTYINAYYVPVYKYMYVCPKVYFSTDFQRS